MTDININSSASGKIRRVARLFCGLMAVPIVDVLAVAGTEFEGSADCYPDLQQHVPGLACEESGAPESGYYFLRYRKPVAGEVDIESLAAMTSSRLCGGADAYQWLGWKIKTAAVDSPRGPLQDTVYLEVTVRCVRLDETMERLHNDSHGEP